MHVNEFLLFWWRFENIFSQARELYARTKFSYYCDRDECRLAFYPERRFKFFHRHFDPSENFLSPEALMSEDEPDRARIIDPQSLQLLLSAFYQNFIYRPLRIFGNFIIVTKSIYHNPSSRIDENSLIS